MTEGGSNLTDRGASGRELRMGDRRQMKKRGLEFWRAELREAATGTIIKADSWSSTLIVASCLEERVAHLMEESIR